MQCEDLQYHFADYLAGTLTEPVRSEMLEHLASCASCRTESEELKSMWAMRHAIPSEIPDSESLRAQFGAMVETFQQETGQKPHQAPRGVSRRALRLLLAIGLLAISVFAAHHGGLFVMIQPLHPLPPPNTIAPRAVKPIVPENGKNVVEGKAVRAGTSEPLDDVRVTFFQGGVSQFDAVTDAQGRFAIKGVPDGQYGLGVRRDGYLWTAKDSDPEMLTVSSAIKAKDIVLKLIPLGAISGRIVDKTGRPLVNAEVDAMQWTYRNGQRTLSVAATARTNDRGDYRLFWLAPGEYTIRGERRTAISIAFGSQDAYTPSYYPGVVNAAAATSLTLREGGQLAAIDFKIQPAVAVKVSGTIINALVDASVRPSFNIFYLTPRGTDATGTPAEHPQQFVNRLRSSQEFEIAGVLPGSYDLFSTAPGSSSVYAGRTTIDVGGEDLDGVKVVLHAGVEVKGEVIVRGNTEAVALDSVHLRLSPKDNLPRIFVSSPAFSRVGVDATGSFALQDVPQSRYDILVSGLPQDVYVADIFEGEHSVYDSGISIGDAPPEPIQIVVNTEGSIIGGIVRNRDLKPVANVTVVLVPEPDRRQNAALYKELKTKTSGRFEFRGVAPGRYKVFAWESIPRSAYQSPEYLARYEKAGHVVNAGPGAKIDLQLSVIASEP